MTNDNLEEKTKSLLNQYDLENEGREHKDSANYTSSTNESYYEDSEDDWSTGNYFADAMIILKSYYKYIIPIVAIPLLLVLIITVPLFLTSSGGDEETIARYDNVMNELFTLLYSVDGAEEVVKNNPYILSLFDDTIKHVVDFKDEEAYLDRYVGFNNEPLDVTIQTSFISKEDEEDYIGYIEYVIHSDLNVDSNRYAIVRFNRDGLIYSFNEYYSYPMQ